MIFIEVSEDEELTAVRVALAGLLINPGAAPYLKAAATRVLQRVMPLVGDTTTPSGPTP